MNFGGLYSFAQDFTKFSGELVFTPGTGLVIPQKHDTWALYWSAWQYLYVQDPNDHPIDLANGVPDHKGIGVFARFGVADRDTNPTRWSGSVGLGGRGLIPSRDDDAWGVGYYYTRVETSQIISALGIDREGQGFEAYYNLAITRAAHLTFDVQVQNPALPNIDTAVILGARLNLGF